MSTKLNWTSREDSKRHDFREIGIFYEASSWSWPNIRLNIVSAGPENVWFPWMGGGPNNQSRSLRGCNPSDCMESCPCALTWSRGRTPNEPLLGTPSVHLRKVTRILRQCLLGIISVASAWHKLHSHSKTPIASRDESTTSRVHVHKLLLKHRRASNNPADGHVHG